MEAISSPLRNGYGNKSWKRGNYRRLNSGSPQRRRVKIVKLGGKLKQRHLRILKMASPMKLFKKFKSACVNMMLTFTGQANKGKHHGEPLIKRVSPVSVEAAMTEKMTQNKMVQEIFKSLLNAYGM